MATQSFREKLWTAYEKLPKEIKDVVFADETLDQIENICKQNNISEDEKISNVTKSIRDVLFGFSPPNGLQKTLEENSGLDKKTAKKIAQEINQHIFAPIESVLEKLYNKETNIDRDKTLKEEAPKKSPGKDIYREPVE